MREDPFIYKGVIVENSVAILLNAIGVAPLYYMKPSGMELDFVIESMDLLPIEIKSGTNANSKSLKTAIKEFSFKAGFRFSFSNFSVDKENNIINLPIYSLFLFAENLKTSLQGMIFNLLKK